MHFLFCDRTVGAVTYLVVTISLSHFSFCDFLFLRSYSVVHFVHSDTLRFTVFLMRNNTITVVNLHVRYHCISPQDMGGLHFIVHARCVSV